MFKKYKKVLFTTIFISTTFFCFALSFQLYDYGTEEVVDYQKYGQFVSTGTRYFKYIIKDKKGLAKAVGEGIFPNESVYEDPQYLELKNSGQLEGSHWNFVSQDIHSLEEHKKNFYKWSTVQEDPGVKLYYTALTLEKAALKKNPVDYKLLKHAIKTYYAIVIHSPRSVGYTYWGTPWYVAPVAIDKIKWLCKKFPQLNLDLVDAYVIIENGHNDKTTDDVFIVSAGKFVNTSANIKVGVDKTKVKKTVGDKNLVQLLQYENGHWEFFYKGEPMLIKAVAYSPAPVGTSPDTGSWNTYRDWLFMDKNNDGILDVLQIWIDKNRNNKMDKDEIIQEEFELMKEMGVNTIRLYHHGHNKNLLRYIYEKYGIKFLMGDFLGMYAIGSGAGWYEGTDYTDPIHQQNMMSSVKDMVLEYKDEPYVIMWVLGNENNYGIVGDENFTGMGCRAKSQPDAYYYFVNEVAKYIKSLDPYKRPVAICNGDLLYLDYIAKYCPDVDVIGVNAYRGAYGFGWSLWNNIKRLTNKPVLITEYGCPAYAKGVSEKEAEKLQAEYLKGNWEDIYYNSCGYGVGNAIGGVSFEWVDEWWKAGQPPKYDTYVQEKIGQFTGPFPDGWFYEEFLGVCSQGNGKHSPFMRQLREAYFMYKELWKKM
ncbi:MAG: glycoside hydrolase family 2 TIM barrel-domain containing protein [Endomicrobiia bacterium]